MDQNTSLSRVRSTALEAAVPVAAYPVSLSEDGGAAPALLGYWRVLRKRRWTILSLLLLVVATTLIGTLKQRPVYRAKAVLQIDRENPNVLSFQDAVTEINPYDDSYFETAYKILSSRSLAYRVIQKLDLAHSPEFAARSAGAIQAAPGAPVGGQPLDSQDSEVIDHFLRRLQINPVRRSQLVEISFDAYDPAQSAQIVNTLASSYMEMNLEAKWDAAQKASDWLSSQLVGLKAKLEKSEEDLQNYAKDNSILFLDEKQNMSTEKLQQLQEEDTKAEADLIQKEAVYRQAQGGDFRSASRTLESDLYEQLTLRLTDLRKQYSELTATFAPEYPSVQKVQSQMDQLTIALEQEKAAVAQRVTDDYQAALRRKQLLDQAVAQQTQQVHLIAGKSIQYNILRREAETNKQLYDGLLQRMKEDSISAGLKASNVRIVDPAETPRRPFKPRTALNLALALFVGLSVGVGAAFLQEHLDNTLKTAEDVQQFLRVPALGVIPVAGRSGRKKLSGRGYRTTPLLPIAAAEIENAGRQRELVPADASTAEAYRSLRTSVLLSTPGHAPKTCLVTSAHPGEGKTTTTVNLAIALTQLGGRVLMVDSDMRRPRIGAGFGLQAAAGLSTYLAGQSSMEEATCETKIPNLYIMPCGPIPPNPAELLSSPFMRDLLLRASQEFSYILLDSPPVLHVTDARILATQVDAVILVVHGGVTPREAVRHAKDHLQRGGNSLIGVALNNVELSEGDYGYYYKQYRGYDYGQHEQHADEKLTPVA